MSETSTITPVAATLPELKAAVPGMSSDFYLGCLERNLTVSAASTEAHRLQAEEITKLRAKAAEPKKDEEDDEDEKESKKECKNRSRVQPGTERTETARSRTASADPISEFNTLVREFVSQGQPRRTAVKMAARQEPALHEEYLLATNAGKPEAQKLIRTNK